MNHALQAHLAEYLVDPAQGELDGASEWQSLALVDLDTCVRDAHVAALPPFPVVGLGDPSHPLASKLDCVLEPPIAVEQLIAQVERAPHTAAVIVQLLRAIEGMPVDRALIVESFAYGLLQGSGEFAAWLAGTQELRTQPSSPGAVHVERVDSVLHITIDRPAMRNAIDREIRDRLHEAFTLAATDPTITLVKFRGVGEAFCAGADLNEFGTTLDPTTAHLIRSWTLPATAIAKRADVLEVHIQGPCVGAGLEMAAFARRVTAAPNAWFQLPELAMGLLPGAGGSVSVSKRIGRQRAALIMLSGQRIDATTALRWGLIDAIENHTTVDQRRSHEG